MDKLPVGQLPDLQQSNNDDEIMVITNSEYNQLKKEKISDLITDFTSTNENNALTKGTDGKMFVTDFGNASNITEGTLPIEVLPSSGVTADTYAYPSSVTVNAQGQVTAIEEGTPSGANADTDLSNLTPTGEKHFLNKTQITNCLLEVPQRVKLTFDNDQGLVLHAGSEVIVPYGKGTPTMQIGDALNGGVISDVQVVGDDNKIFYYITYNSDIVVGKTIGTGDSTYWLCVTPEGTIAGDITEDIYSQAAQPTGISESVVWYDTTNNYVKVTLNTGSSWTQGNSLLIGRLNRTGTGTITSIRDIYNGAGVIGSTIWCDKGVKGLIPSGRNTDGSLHNRIVETETLLIDSWKFSTTSELRYAQLFKHPNEDSLPSVGWNSASSMNYDKLINLNLYDYGGGDIRPTYCINLFSFTADNNRINNIIDFSHAFNALDSNNTEFIAHQAMPSSNYIKLSLPASEGTLVAPAEGYAVINASSNTANAYISLNIKDSTSTIGILQDLKMVPETGKTIATSLPVSKGEIIQVGYYGISLKSFRFVYANGSI